MTVFTVAALFLTLVPPAVGGYWFWLHHMDRKLSDRVIDSAAFSVGIVGLLALVVVGPSIGGAIGTAVLLIFPFFAGRKSRKETRS